MGTTARRRVPSAGWKLGAVGGAVALITSGFAVSHGGVSEAAVADAALGRAVYCEATDGNGATSPYGHDAVNLVDGNDSTQASFTGGYNHTNNLPYRMSCAVDLGQPEPLTELDLTFGSDGTPTPAVFGEQFCTQKGIIDWQLEGSVDGTTWTLLTAAMSTAPLAYNPPGTVRAVPVTATVEFVR